VVSVRRATGTILALTATATLAALSLAAAPTPKPAVKPVAAASGRAPADESLGPFKYTAISVRTKIDFLGRSYRERWANDASIMHDAGLVESSFRVWALRYPYDPWLAPTGLHLAQLYAEIQTPTARSKALALFRYVAQTYPTTKEGRAARVRLAKGLRPVHEETAVAPTTSPYAASPQPSAEAAASVTPAPTAPPSATPAPKPKR
jgi:hypothetical protein